MKKEVSYICPRCVEEEVKIVAEGRMEGPFEKQEFYQCHRCGWFGNEKALFVKPAQVETAEFKGIAVDPGVAYALQQDLHRGEPGGGGSSGSNRTPPPKAPIRSEQDVLLFGDQGERSAQAFLRDLVYGAKFTQQEAAGLEAAIAHSGLGKSKWIQRALVGWARLEMEAAARQGA